MGTKSITVRIDKNYGREAIYPVCLDAHRFTEIAGSKTLTRQTLRLIKDLGYTLEIQANAQAL